MVVFHLIGLVAFWHTSFKKRNIALRYNPHPLTLHLEAATFFDLKSQIEKCFQLLAEFKPRLRA
jgi:hypothetical protein